MLPGDYCTNFIAFDQVLLEISKITKHMMQGSINRKTHLETPYAAQTFSWGFSWQEKGDPQKSQLQHL